MGLLGIFALIILLVLGLAVICAWFTVAILPGRIAGSGAILRRRH